MRRDITEIRILDVIPVLIVLSVSAAILVSGFFSSDSADFFSVQTESGKTVYRFSKDDLIEIHSSGYSLTVSVRNGEVSVLSSDCPDKICLNSSPVTGRGGTIVCVPAHVIIKSEGGDPDGIDWTAP